VGRVRELAERCWSGGAEPYALWKPTGATEEIAPGVFFLHAFANVTVLRARDGLVLVDPAPLRAAIYTHGHADHAFGLPPSLAEAALTGWPRPRIVAHRDHALRPLSRHPGVRVRGGMSPWPPPTA
jgi:glyoxylase-like metal-dependent hydrolase (beta-lactamase superfamily II)